MSDNFLRPVIEKLAGLLAEEATLLNRVVHQKVESLNGELEIVQRFLKDAEERSLRGVQQEVKSLKDELEMIQTMLEDAEAMCDAVDEIRAQADSAEEVIDGYYRHLSEIPDDHQSGLSGSLGETCQLILSLKPRHEIACEIRSIRRSLSQIKGVGLGYGLRQFEEGGSSNGEARAELLSGSLHVEEVIANLVEGLATRSVVSLLGDGGFGKTTSTTRKVFDDLPYFLRSCLLYFGIFSEGYFITDERLYRLWIAEGLVEAKGDKTSEEVAEEYLSELVKKNLVSCDEGRPIGEGKWFRVHNSLSDFTQSRVDELYSGQILDEKKSEFKEKGRCLTISGSRKNALKNVEGVGVRSLFLSGINDDQVAKEFMVSFFEKFKLLEVLDVENAMVDTLPKEVANLLWLKYLSLRNTKVKVLPKSIGKLRNLQSLDIRDSSIRELPNELNKLRKLCHLLAYSYDKYGSPFTYVLGVRLQEGFGYLEDLQTLTLVEANLGVVGLMKELEKLRKLRWLGISNCTRETVQALCAVIEKMNHLERLFLATIDESEVLDLQHISSPPPFLRELLLVGRLEKLPPWILELSNLSGLCLFASRLSDDPIKSLKALPNLENLDLSTRAYEGEQLHFEEGDFVKLKKLSMNSLENLKAVRVDRGALPVLEELVIANCRLLEEMPSVEHLGNINTVRVNGMRFV